MRHRWSSTDGPAVWRRAAHCGRQLGDLYRRTPDRCPAGSVGPRARKPSHDARPALYSSRCVPVIRRWLSSGCEVRQAGPPCADHPPTLCRGLPTIDLGHVPNDAVQETANWGGAVERLLREAPSSAFGMSHRDAHVPRSPRCGKAWVWRRICPSRRGRATIQPLQAATPLTAAHAGSDATLDAVVTDEETIEMAFPGGDLAAGHCWESQLMLSQTRNMDISYYSSLALQSLALSSPYV